MKPNLSIKFSDGVAAANAAAANAAAQFSNAAADTKNAMGCFLSAITATLGQSDDEVEEVTYSIHERNSPDGPESSDEEFSNEISPENYTSLPSFFSFNNITDYISSPFSSCYADCDNIENDSDEFIVKKDRNTPSTNNVREFTGKSIAEQTCMSL